MPDTCEEKSGAVLVSSLRARHMMERILMTAMSRMRAFGVAWCCLVCLPIHAAAQDLAQPQLVREVLAGTRDEARVSWWGFDAEDSTRFLQDAIQSKARKLIIDRQATPWITRPLTGVSNQEIILEEGVELVAKKGDYRAKGDCLLSFRGCENVTIRGEKKGSPKPARIRMHKKDYQSDAYEKSEWRHGLVFAGCRHVLVRDLAIEETGGDGIYLGAGPNKNPNLDVVIRRVDCNKNHRQGISVISAENLLIEDCLLRNTEGTAPESGVDFEPNNPYDLLVNCIMRNCVAENNAGRGYEICPQSMNSGSKPISIHLDKCVSRKNKLHGIHLCSAPKDPPGGLLRITHFLSEEDRMAGLSVQFNPYDAIRIEMEDTVIRDSAREDSFFAPIYMQGIESDDRPTGNLHFKRVTIKDDKDRPFFKVNDKKGNGVRDITGEIVLERGGRKETIKMETWLSGG